MQLPGKTDLVSVDVSVKDVLYALEHDPEFFINFFLGDELTYPVPQFHIDIFLKMTSLKVNRFACAIPRAHAKTTLAKLACIWLFLFSPYRFIIYVSNTSRIAVDAAVDIRAFLLSDNFISVFGPPDFSIDRQGDGIYKFVIRDKVCILRALGAGQQVRGINIDNQRPQCAVVDDLEDNDNIATEQLFEKLTAWFYGPFLKCLDKRNNKVIQLGNMISNRQMLKNHCQSPRWHSMKFGCLLADGTPLWKEAWSLDALKEDFNEYLEQGKLDIWYAEMMNMPMAAGKGLITVDKIFYKPAVDRSDVFYGCITVDVAISRESWAHKTAIVAHGWTGDCWQTLESHAQKGMDPIDLLDKIIEFAYRWGVSIVGIESVAFQASLKPIYEYICNMRQIEGLEFRELYYVGKKTHRLASWASMIKKKEYGLLEGDFSMTEQLLGYDPKKKENDDDEIDAASFIIQMIEEYIFDIMQKKEIVQQQEIQYIHEYGTV